MQTARSARKRALAKLYPRERWTPWEWAEHCRVLGADESSEPGKWRLDRVPYVKEVLEVCATPGVEQVGMVKGAQVAWSDSIERNLFGHWIDLDPGPLLILNPDRKSSDDYTEERLKPLLQNTPALRSHIANPKDVTQERIKLDTMSIFMAWGGSSQSVKSRPIRRLSVQEPDEIPLHSGGGGSPISKAEKRLTTYRDKGRSLALYGGTPTTRLGFMWRWWENCSDKRYYWVPCPHCRKYQRLQWGAPGEKGGGVKWKCDEPDRVRRADRVELEGLAYYQCEFCAGEIRDHHKPMMLRAGRWANEDQVIREDGTVVGPKRESKRIGFHLSGLYSPWVTFSQLAGEWIRAQGNRGELMDFINQRLAEPFEEQRSKSDPTLIARKAKNGPPPRVVPRWTKMLIATADTQGADEKSGYFYFTIRAWAHEYRSQLVHHGVVISKDELRKTCLDTAYPVEGGGVAAPQVLLVDSGGPRWSEIYQFALTDTVRIKATKGMNRPMRWMVDERFQKNHNVVLWEIDTEQAKDTLHRLIFDPDMGRWMPNAAVIDQTLSLEEASERSDYCRHMAAERKIVNPQSGKEEWVEIVTNMNHLYDCEAIQCAAAWRFGAMTAAPPETQPKQAIADEPNATAWLPDRPEKWSQ